MKKKLVFIMLLISALMPLQLSAQKTSLQNIKKFSLQNISAITENGEVKGYVAFYLIDKKNRKESNFKLTIWDANLTLKYDIDLVRPASTFFLEASYNGDVFCVSFFNRREKKKEFVMFDQDGKETGTYATDKMSRLEIQLLSASQDVTPNLVAIPNVGFAFYGLDPESDNNSMVTILGRDGKKKWSAIYSGTDKNDLASAYPIAHDENLLVSVIPVRESKYSQKIKGMNVKFHEAETGKELFTFENKQEKYQYSVSRVTSEKDNIYIYGEYLDANADIIKDDTKGLFVLITDKKGNIQKESYTNWADIQKSMPGAMLSDKGKPVRLTMHEIIKTADDKHFIICEQFYRTADAMGIIAVAGGNSAAVTKIVLQNMVVLEFDPDFKFAKGSVVKKNRTNVTLPAGMDFYGAPFIAFYLKSMGRFDYCFTNEATDKKTFSSIYVNYDKEAEKGTKTIGSISYNKNGEIVEDKINLTSKPTAYMVFPAKAGYVTIFEYFKKTKSMDIRMERLNM